MQPSETRDEAVYDAYLDACAAGCAEPPYAVFRRNPGICDVVRARIEALWRATGEGRAFPRASQLGPWNLVERLDSGGMGTVYRAIHRKDGSERAVKVLRPELAGSATATERLRREALALSRLRHPNVVRVDGFGVEGEVAYLVLELVRGRGLEEIVAEASARGELLPWGRVAAWGAALARGLQAAHDEGVVHRDVKPANVRVRPDDTPALIDFGIARVPESTPGALTTTFAGSPFYASPEQLTGAALDGRADVYGLCATLYQGLTGRVPFSGDRFDAILRRVLTEVPVPVRRLAPHVPRALETVVLAGLEKDPARRPPSARALAEDLEAALRGRRVRARRPGPLRSAARWVRRRPLLASAAAFGLLAFALAAGVPWMARRAERERRHEEARAAVHEAQVRASAYAAGTEVEERLAASLRAADMDAQNRWISDVELARVDAEERQLERLRRDREAEFHGVLALLDRAERLVPDAPGAGACRARLYLARWREARAAGDRAAVELYRRMIEGADPGGPAAREVVGNVGITVAPEPPGADVHLFRVVPRGHLVGGGGPQLVPVPLRGLPADLPPAPWALRVCRGAGDVAEGEHVVRIAGHPVEGCVLAARAAEPLRALDRIVEIGGVAVHDAVDAERLGDLGPERVFVFERPGARVVVSATSLAELGVVPASAVEVAQQGGVPATLWTDGTLRETVLPSGLEVRATAAPLLAGEGSRVPGGPLHEVALPMGDYVVLVRAPGRVDVRLDTRLEVPGARVRMSPRLPTVAERPPGFVLVAAHAAVDLPDFWIQEREVTAEEYLEFLNDPATLDRLDAAAETALVPRHEIDPPLWSRGPDGRFALPAETRPDHPVLGVSFADARAYADWLTARALRRGEPWRYRLPTFPEWTRAAGGGSAREYPFGERFRARWVSSCYARRRPAPEPVLSFPIDESPLGVFDACGSAMEWVDDWYDEPRGLRRLAGGSWAQGEPRSLRVYAPRGARPDRADREFGLRLVAERSAR